MPRNQYSEDLMDALMSGNIEAAKEIQSKIDAEKDAKFRANFPETAKQIKKDTTVVNFNTVLNDDNSSARKIYDFLEKNIGDDWWEDEIETIDRLIWLKYGSVLSEVNKDKVLALRHLCRNDAAFFDWYEFNQMALSFGGAIADFDFIRKPSPGMIINAVHMLNYVRPDREKQFSIDVLKYI